MLVQQFSGGQTGDEAERRRRREASKALLAQFERAVKPIRDLLTQLRDKKSPDYGPLQACASLAHPAHNFTLHLRLGTMHWMPPYCSLISRE